MSTQKIEAQEIAPQPFRNPLLLKKIHPMQNWYQWVKHWDATDDLELLESLLHHGFTVSMGRMEYGEKDYDTIDRLSFYFSVANGRLNQRVLKSAEDGQREYAMGYDRFGNIIRKEAKELRQQVAGKAFDMLCLNFFKLELFVKDDRKSCFHGNWEGIVASERLFPVICNFFAIEKAPYGDDFEIKNLNKWEENRSHNEGQAVTFLVNLARFIWKWQRPDEYWTPVQSSEKERCDGIQDRLESAKPWAAQVLAMLGKFDLLDKLELDDRSLAALKEVALSARLMYSHGVETDRPAKTIEEACVAGSKIAIFLLQYHVKRNERKRLKRERVKEIAAKQRHKKLAAE